VPCLSTITQQQQDRIGRDFDDNDPITLGVHVMIVSHLILSGSTSISLGTPLRRRESSILSSSREVTDCRGSHVNHHSIGEISSYDFFTTTLARPLFDIELHWAFLVYFFILHSRELSFHSVLSQSSRQNKSVGYGGNH
jgi:hypothetical protein